MPTEVEAQNAIESRLTAEWLDQDVELRFENDPRKLPTGSHIILHLRHVVTTEVGYSGNNILYRRFGMIVAQCFVEAKNGTKIARGLADAVLDVYEAKQFGSISCNQGEVVPVGDNKDGFWQCNAKIFYDHDFQRSY